MPRAADTGEQMAQPKPLAPHLERLVDAARRDDIVRQMHAVLRSDKFRRSHLLRRMLRFLIEQSLLDDICVIDATTIAKAVFGKGPDFRSSKDSRVRVAANRLRMALLLYYAYDGIEDKIIFYFERGSYRPVVKYRSTCQS